jgi:hypothetical protein
MSATSTRLFLGFLAGFLSHLIFQGGLGSILYAAHLVPALPWSPMPVPPLGVPKSLLAGSSFFCVHLLEAKNSPPMPQQEPAGVATRSWHART